MRPLDYLVPVEIALWLFVVVARLFTGHPVSRLGIVHFAQGSERRHLKADNS